MLAVEVKLSRLELVQGDITEQNVDAIANAANSQLRGGGGVDGAIHRAGGPALMEELRRNFPNGCKTGSAVMTQAGELNAKYVFHAVGPIWEGGQYGEELLLQNAYRTCLELALKHHCQSIAFPAISTGVYGYPVDLAAQTIVTTMLDFLQEQTPSLLVRVVLFDAGSYAAFHRVLEELIEERQGGKETGT